MRSIEIPAVGGIMLAPDSEEHRILFDRLDSIFYYRDIIEMTENIKHILILSSENIQRIKLNLHNYMKKKSYAYSQHAKELYQKF
jgi:hypothetical protein